MMQDLSFSVIIFYYAFVTLLSLGVVYVGQVLLFGTDFGRIFIYDRTQMAWILATTFLHMLSLSARTIANQNEKSGLITLIAYVGIVYAYFGDYFLFDERYSSVQIICIFVILALNIGVILHKETKSKENDDDFKKIKQ